ncbi:hypothetical protein GE061_001145 [Apolygus lucorum]|uniref:WD repeat-containing protein 55 homolog n=1 Tax=Apolygus lucorum TaxID=248454 RepID=A0A6A4K0Y6_APOLU|nr:hypothetical protein GE061_001145 [Apolygus lucorum]
MEDYSIPNLTGEIQEISSDEDANCEREASDVSSEEDTNSDEENDATDAPVVIGDEEEDDDVQVVEDIRKRKEMTNSYPCILECESTIHSIAFNPIKLEVALAGDGVKLYVVQEDLFELDFIFKIEEELKLITYDQAGSCLFGVDSKSLYVLEREHGKTNRKTSFETPVTAMEAGSDKLVFGTEDGDVIGVNTTSFTVDFRLKVRKEQITTVRVWSHYAYAVCENYVYMVDQNNGKLTHENVHAVDLAAGVVRGACFVGGSTDGELVMFKLTPSKTVYKGTYRVTRKSSVTALANIDDEFVAVAFDDGLIKMCSVFPNREVGVIGSMQTFATHMVVSPDEEWLVASDSLKGVKVFKLTEIGDASPPRKKRKPARDNQLQSSSHENKSDFFSSL